MGPPEQHPSSSLTLPERVSERLRGLQSVYAGDRGVINHPRVQHPGLSPDRCLHQGIAHTILDGTLITTDRITGVRENGNDLWFSQKHKAFGGNLQFLSAPDGTPLWVSDAEPGSTPDITAARIHALPALYKAAAQGLPVLADKGYQGAGIGVHTPIKRPTGKSEGALHTDTRMYNALLRHVRALGERTAAELKERWRALKHVTLSPCRIGDIARATLVLNRRWK
ncbi:transposase family protein [Nocardiopsis sp. NPDC055879]